VWTNETGLAAIAQGKPGLDSPQDVDNRGCR